jgi:hypothetical protein
MTNLPFGRLTSIRWDQRQSPFVEAETDGDAAFAPGLGHARLRLRQMGVVRRIVQGRPADEVAPFMEGEPTRMPSRPASGAQAFRRRIMRSAAK